MSKKYIIGNWKLNPTTKKEAVSLARDLSKLLPQNPSYMHSSFFSRGGRESTYPSFLLGSGGREVAQATEAYYANRIIGCTPSFVHLPAVKKNLAEHIALGVQDIDAHTATTGAFTGGVSAAQVANLGATFTLVGHSERRNYQHESEADFIAKIKHAFENNMSVIFCVGETKEAYDKQETLNILQKQIRPLTELCSDIDFSEQTTDLPKLIIAYEPVWAIGTGLTPTLTEIETAHSFIKEFLGALHIHIPIIYGGSVNVDNAKILGSSPMIDGILVGKASLDASNFAQIVEAFYPPKSFKSKLVVEEVFNGDKNDNPFKNLFE